MQLNIYLQQIIQIKIGDNNEKWWSTDHHFLKI